MNLFNKNKKKNSANKLALNKVEEIKQLVWIKAFNCESLLDQKMNLSFFLDKRPPVEKKILLMRINKFEIKWWMHKILIRKSI